MSKIRQTKLWERYENNLLNEGLTEKRRQKLAMLFRTLERHFSVDFGDITREQIEDFVNKLNRDKIKKISGSSYSGSTKSDIKKFIKQFWRWFKGDNEFYPKEVAWIKGKISKDEKPKDKPVLSLEEVKKLANSFSKVKYKIAVLILFDSGFRIQELLSVRKKDISWEEYSDADKCFWISCNESKTETRKVPIPLFTEDIKFFFNSVDYEQLKEDDLVFNFNYRVFTNWLSKKSKKIFGKHITSHCLRHSSATYYSKELDGNMNLIAQRYGWSFSSGQMKTYIRRSGAYQTEGVKKIFTNELSEVKKRLDRQDQIIQEAFNMIIKFGVADKIRLKALNK